MENTNEKNLMIACPENDQKEDLAISAWLVSIYIAAVPLFSFFMFV
jgi:hypothetical protein